MVVLLEIQITENTFPLLELQYFLVYIYALWIFACSACIFLEVL